MDEELFKQLKLIRTALAREKKVPPYIIFSDKSLTEMAAVKPQNNEEFLSISGVGEKKLKAYGPHFLPAIQGHLNRRQNPPKKAARP